MKKSNRKSDKQKSKNSSDISIDNKFKSLSREIQNMYTNLRLIEMLQEIHQNEFRTNNLFAYNFVINTPTKEELMSQTFESCPLITKKKSNDYRPPIDIITGDNEVTITIDMPDTKIENIGLLIIRDIVEIMPNNPKGKYHRIINLPCLVKSKTAKFSYRNGILDIILKKEKEK